MCWTLKKFGTFRKLLHWKHLDIEKKHPYRNVCVKEEWAMLYKPQCVLIRVGKHFTTPFNMLGSLTIIVVNMIIVFKEFTVRPFLVPLSTSCDVL